MTSLLLSILLFSVADPVPVPKVDPIRLPTFPVLPLPSPAPAPGGVTTLGPDQLFIVDSDVGAIVLSSPPGLVTVTEDAGPIRIRGKFVDASGKVESRTYKGKSVFTIEPTGVGRVELLIVPAGAITAADVIRRTIDVTTQGPIPPPVVPPVVPQPMPVDPLAVSVQAAFTADVSLTKAADKVALAAVLLATADAASTPAVVTADHLFSVLHGATEARLPGRLKGVRAVIGAELGKVLPADPKATLTTQHKTDAATQMRRLATILEGVR